MLQKQVKLQPGAQSRLHNCIFNQTWSYLLLHVVQAIAAKQLCDWVWHSPVNNEPLVNINHRAVVTFLTNLQTDLCVAMWAQKAFSLKECSKDVFLNMFLLVHYAFTITGCQSCVSMEEVCFCSQLATDCDSLSALQRELPCARSVFCCRCCLSHAAPCEAVAGARSSRSSRKECSSVLSCSGQDWVFYGAVWVRQTVWHPPLPQHVQSLIASHALKADGTTVISSGMSDYTAIYHVFMCWYKLLECILIICRCIR